MGGSTRGQTLGDLERVLESQLPFILLDLIGRLT